MEINIDAGQLSDLELRLLPERIEAIFDKKAIMHDQVHDGNDEPISTVRPIPVAKLIPFPSNKG